MPHENNKRRQPHAFDTSHTSTTRADTASETDSKDQVDALLLQAIRTIEDRIRAQLQGQLAPSTPTSSEEVQEERQSTGNSSGSFTIQSISAVDIPTGHVLSGHRKLFDQSVSLFGQDGRRKVQPPQSDDADEHESEPQNTSIFSLDVGEVLKTYRHIRIKLLDWASSSWRYTFSKIEVYFRMTADPPRVWVRVHSLVEILAAQ